MNATLSWQWTDNARKREPHFRHEMGLWKYILSVENFLQTLHDVRVRGDMTETCKILSTTHAYIHCVRKKTQANLEKLQMRGCDFWQATLLKYRNTKLSV